MNKQRIASQADIERIEAQPYEDFMPHATVFRALEDAAARYSGRRALTYVIDPQAPGAVMVWSYADFIRDVRKAANLFSELAGGDAPRVAMLLPAIPQAHFTLWGAETVGVACPINYLLDAEHIAHLINATGANILVALGPNPELDIWARVPSLREKCPGLKYILAVGADGTATVPGALDFDARLAAQPDTPPSEPTGTNANSLVAMFHTGGTTGAPKLAQHTHRNQLHSGWSAAQMYAMTEHDVIVNGFPMFHVAGSIVYGISTLLSGAEILIPTLLGMRSQPFVSRYWRLIERHGVTLLAVVPTVISTIMSVDPTGADLKAVRAALTGGSPLPPELAIAFEQRFDIPVRNILGMTECAGVVAIEPVLAPRVPGSCGLRLPFSRVEAIAGEMTPDSVACPPGEAGVLRLRGPNVGPGYTDPRRNAGTFSDDGWLSTGDIGYVDSNGLIYITGREKDVIIRSGHNIEPAMIESALMQHPDVQFAAAVGEPDEYAGEMPMAYVVLKPGAATDAAELLNFIKPLIPERPAHPKRVVILPSLPLTAVGKVYKPALRLQAMVRTFTERLRERGLANVVAIEGQESAKGLSLQFIAPGGKADESTRLAVHQMMAGFAIPWTWQE